jgi:hypothetical protein
MCICAAKAPDKQTKKPLSMSGFFDSNIEIEQLTKGRDHGWQQFLNAVRSI